MEQQRAHAQRLNVCSMTSATCTWRRLLGICEESRPPKAAVDSSTYINVARARGPLGIQGFWTGPFGGAFLVLVLDLIRSPLFASWSRKKSSLERLLSGPRRISRQVSGILGAERLPQGTLGASKMGSKIGSGLKKVKYQKI